MTRAIVPIVEGKADADAIRILLMRILHSVNVYDVLVARPFRLARTRVKRENEIERTVTLAVKPPDREKVSAVLVIMDSDDDCPAALGPELLRRCKSVTQLPVAVVLAKKEFESWFLGAKESLRGVRGIRNDATAPQNPEEIRGAKGQLSRNMEGSRHYRCAVDQAVLANKMDLELARQRCPSFDKLVRDVRKLLSSLARAGN